MTRDEQDREREPWQDDPDLAEVTEADAASDAIDQRLEASRALSLPGEKYLHIPYATVDRLVGGIAPGQAWFVAAYSGNGKTTFLLSLVRDLLLHDRTVYYLGLESRPHILRTQLACLRVGYDAGEILSGASRAWPHWPSARAELVADLERQSALSKGNKFLIDGRPSIDAFGLASACRDAAWQGADLLIIDHIDHLALGNWMSAWEQSRRVAMRLLEDIQQYGLRALVATQLNNDAVRGDRLAMYQPPQTSHVYMGGHKMHVATGMLGLYRPLRTDVTPEELKRVRDGSAIPATVLEPQTMAVVCMKHRLFGSRVGARGLLRLERGRLSDLPERDCYGTSREAQP